MNEQKIEISEKEKIEELRKKLTELVRVEKQKKAEKKHYNATLIEVDPDVLEEDDLSIFQAFLDHALTPEMIREYQDKNCFYSATDERVKRRGYLLAVINNELGYPDNMKWYDPESYEYMIKKRNKGKK